MSKIIKYILILVSLILFPLHSLGYATINAEKNAYIHNNKGLLYLEDNYYFGAIKEFQIAIDLLPDKQASAVFYTNLANTYEKIGHKELAMPLYEKALSLNCLYFDYYLKLAESYKKNGNLKEKLAFYENKNDSPYNEIMTGLLYIQNGDITTGIIILDNFCDKEPSLIITPGIRAYINKISDEKL